jgi:sugar lactone lactonase YvrE
MKLKLLIKQSLKAFIIFLFVCLLTECSKKKSDPVPVPKPIPVLVSTFAGSGSQGSANGLGIAASFNDPLGITVDAKGNIYVADYGNYMIRKITPAGTVSTYAGTGTKGSTVDSALLASFNSPDALAADHFGNLYLTDQDNLQIRKISPAGIVSIFAGSGKVGSDNGVGIAASFSSLNGIATDAAGNVYVSDSNVIRKISRDGTVSTFATGDSTNALDEPSGIAIDAKGNIYVSDTGNNLIREISSGGVISTFAGSGKQGNADGTGTAASFNFPEGLAADAAGNLFVADVNNRLIRMITPAGVVTTIAGGGTVAPNTNGTGTESSFYTPTGIAIDASGNIYISDTNNELIRKVVKQ